MTIIAIHNKLIVKFMKLIAIKNLLHKFAIIVKIGQIIVKCC
jgi:hypothetical protein